MLARPVEARLTQPPADVSAMDGYALRAADAAVGARLRVTGASPAGHPFAGAVGPGEAVRIFTGGVLPAGADAILLQEDATAADGPWCPPRRRAGRWIRRQGLDFRAGEALMEPGRRLTARDIGLAAAANHPWLAVHRRPRVAILATGDEIVLPGEPLPPGGIVSSNAHALAALVRAGGGEPLVLPIAADDREAIAEAAAPAAGCDLLVTTGGASVGEHDLVQSALGPQGFALDFWKIAMRPGKPLIWGRLGADAAARAARQPRLGLGLRRGVPAAGARPPLRPAGRAAADAAGSSAPSCRRTTAAGLPPRDPRPGPDGRPVATPFPVQDSSMLATLARAEALVLRAPRRAGAAERAPPCVDIPLLDLGI